MWLLVAEEAVLVDIEWLASRKMKVAVQVEVSHKLVVA